MKQERKLRVVHISDVHVDLRVPEVPLRDWFGKRVVGGANHVLRRRRHFRASEAKLHAMAAFCEAQQIDMVICTGDYTILGTAPELQRARRAIEPLTRFPMGYVTVPGNHDVYLLDGVREGRFEGAFGDLMGTDWPEYAVDGVWPQVRVIDDRLAVVAVNSARPNPQVLRSSGRVPEAQLKALGSILNDPRMASRFTLVITHYGIRLPNGRPDHAGHGLENADELVSISKQAGWGALLHGHIHHCYHLDSPVVPFPIFCAGSTTYEGREGFWLFEIARDEALAVRGGWDGTGYTLTGENYTIRPL